LLPDSSDLLGQFVFDNLPPNLTAFTILVGTTLQACELFPTFSDECVQSNQLRFKFGGLTLWPFHIPTFLAQDSPFSLRCHYSSLAGNVPGAFASTPFEEPSYCTTQAKQLIRNMVFDKLIGVFIEVLSRLLK
jgi:hypothetical protein